MITCALALTLTLSAGVPAAAPAVKAAADSVRELHVVVLIHTRSFARVLDASQIERLQEEIVEFAEFYRRHGGDRVSFRFTLVQSDRELRRFEVEEVAPGRHYLSRKDVHAELQSLDLGGGDVDEVVAFYAWSNANPDGAVLAYGGGAVGPDGNFLGDAGYNSIGVFAFDPARIAQIAIHEVLHNIDDMFSRAGMADGFLNSDEMSRNMATLLAERPGAFEPWYDDAGMLAYAERERSGRDAYPWWMQRIYYAWMLERTPAETWRALRHGRMVPLARPGGVRPLYDDVLISRATTRLYLPALATDSAAARRLEVGGARGSLAPRRWTLEDFDGTPIVEGDYFGGWIDLDGTDSVAVLAIGGGTTTIHRLRLGDIAAPARIAALIGDDDAAFEVVAREAGWPEPGPIIEDAVVAALAPNSARLRGTGSLRVPLPASPGSTWFDVAALAEGFVFPFARVEAVREAAWSIDAPPSREAAMGTPLGMRIAVRERRPLDAHVIARLPGGRESVLTRAPDGSYVGELDGLPPGLHDIELVARRDGGDVAVDTLRVYARPSGWIRVPRRVEGEAGRVTIEATVRSRMGEVLDATALPLVAVVGARVVPLEFDAGTYRTPIDLPAGEHRVYVTSLTGDFLRRVVLASSRGEGPAVPVVSPALSMPFVAAPRMAAEPVLDGVPDQVPGQRLLEIGPASHVLTSPTAYPGSTYSGAADLDARIGLAWRDDGLYVSGTVRDDDVTMGEAWDRDRINLVFDWREDTTPLTYGSVSPPTTEWQADDYWVFFQPFDAEGGPGIVRSMGREGQRTLSGARLASRRTDDGYTFEVWIPASELPEFVPFEAQVAGLQLFVSDGDGGQPLTELMWSHAWGHTPDGGLAWELSRMGRLVFTGTPLR